MDSSVYLRRRRHHETCSWYMTLRTYGSGRSLICRHRMAHVARADCSRSSAACWLPVRAYAIRNTHDHASNDDDWITMGEPDDKPPADERKRHFYWGRTLFNDTWRLMEKEDRTPEEDDQMVHQAHASAYHWLQVGTPANFARRHWQCNRMSCVLGRDKTALYPTRHVL